MAIAQAFVGIDMSEGSTSYVPPTQSELILAFTNGGFTSTQISVVASGKLQQYFGSFDLASIQQGNYATSTFTGFKQYAGPVAESALEFEVSGASVNGAVIYQDIVNNNPFNILGEVFKSGDSITGSNFDDTLLGFTGGDFVRGREGADSIFGGDQDDRMNGNQGNDSLSGGLGADVFLLSKGVDVIEDFNAAQGDSIEVLSSTPFQLIANVSGDVEIVRDVGTTTLLGVAFATFDPADITVI